MTAEIAILNRSAVALAADSLVTISSGGAQPKNKTYLVNKLFTLSKFRPVGVMINGSAELLGVPWETIVKEYRKSLGTNTFDTIDEYANDFISWLGKNRFLFSASDQKYHFFISIAGYFSHWIKRPIDNKVKERIEASGKIRRSEINGIAKEVIANHLKSLRTNKSLSYLPKNFGQRLSREYGKQIADAKAHALKGFSLTSAQSRQLTSIATNYITRDVWPPNGVSGVVVAGFGEKEKYPAVRVFHTHRVLLDRLVYKPDEDNSPNLNKMPTFSAICPFAQRDVVDSFLGGVDHHFLSVIYHYFSRVMTQWPDVVSQSLPGLKNADKNVLGKRLGKASESILQQFFEKLNEHIKSKHINPTLDTVSILPKEELAAMADALVSLTSAKRKMSLDIETVGGPVDVAVITRGDGFVWIRRKHYFDPSLNPQFHANYFERTP